MNRVHEKLKYTESHTGGLPFFYAPLVSARFKDALSPVGAFYFKGRADPMYPIYLTVAPEPIITMAESRTNPDAESDFAKLEFEAYSDGEIL